MVISIDKFTAIKMYEKVQHYWNEEKRKLVNERNQLRQKQDKETKLKVDEITNILNYMNNTEMAVIISEEANEVNKFKKYDIDISKHRNKMNEITIDGMDIEDRFKDPNNKLQLVFVCSMWLTGFDVPNLSTIYLDKPMKSHTLMQTISRTSRVYPNKTCGLVIDYINVFRFIKQALTDYATGDEGTYPAKNIDNLIELLDSSIEEGDKLLNNLGINLQDIIEKKDIFERLEELRKAYNKIIDTDENKNKFKVIIKIMLNLYQACKPEIYEKHWYNEKFNALNYINGLMHNTIDDEKIKKAKLKITQILDNSVISNTIDNNDKSLVLENNRIDLSKINIEELKKEIKSAEYKAVEIDNLKEYIEKALQKMINQNCTRIKFSERYKDIINRYNKGNLKIEDYYEQLTEFIKNLKNEQKRSKLEELTEEELEIFDLLIQNQILNKEELQKVKIASKNLYKKLITKKEDLFVVDWYKDITTKLRMKSNIKISLNKDLPKCYDKQIFDLKIDLLLNHFIDMNIQSYGWTSNHM